MLQIRSQALGPVNTHAIQTPHHRPTPYLPNHHRTAHIPAAAPRTRTRTPPLALAQNAMSAAVSGARGDEPPSAARLSDLEQKRLRYEALAQRLFTLPHKLRHPGLIPVGPRLFLPGELVNTNRFTVLLGSCGDEAYYAERSALQAQGIVQRRLALIGERAREVSVSADEVRQVLHGGEGTGDVDRAAVEIVGPKAGKKEKRVSFREPVVTHVYGSDKQRTKKKGKKGRKNSGSPKSWDSLKTRAVSADQAHATGDAVPDVSAEGAGDGAEDSQRTGSESKRAETARKVQSELDAAIRAAERRVLEQGVVNITEVFEAEADNPARVELPHGFTPDKNISFDDDSEEFLDMTGPKAGGRGPVTDSATREDYLEALIAAEREEELENAKANADESAKRIQKESREFGQGFAKGFFGAPKAKQGAEASAEQKQPPVTAPADVSRAAGGEGARTQQAVPPADMGEVREHVVERRPGRSRSRRARRGRASSILEMRGMPAPPFVPDVHGIDDDAFPLGAEAPAEDAAKAPSKFREIRNRARESHG